MKASAEGPGSPINATDSMTDPANGTGWRLQALVALRDSLLQNEQATPAEARKSESATAEVEHGLQFLERISRVVPEVPVVPAAPPETAADRQDDEPAAASNESPWELMAKQVLAVAPQQPLLGSWLRFPEQDQIRQVPTPGPRRPVVFLAPENEAVAVSPPPDVSRQELQNLSWSTSADVAEPEVHATSQDDGGELTFGQAPEPPRRGLPKGFWAGLGICFVLAAGLIIWKPWQVSPGKSALSTSRSAPPIAAPPRTDWDSLKIAPGPNETEGRTLLLQHSSPDGPFDLQMTIDLRRNAQQWVMHVRDEGNFNAYGYEVLSRRPLQLLLYRYQVVNGKEGPRAQIPFDVGPNPAPRFPLTTRVEPNRIQLMLNGRVLDTWMVSGHGRVGLMSTPANPADWSDLKVEALGHK